MKLYNTRKCMVGIFGKQRFWKSSP